MKKFIVDEMCGRIVTWLRLLGYDTKYVGDLQSDDRDRTALAVAILENRILITRDRDLIRKAEEAGVIVISPPETKNIAEILTHIFREIKEIPPEKPQSRCPLCNGELTRIPKEHAKEKVPPLTYKSYDVFYMCKQCGKIYWHGSHWRHIKKILETIRKNLISENQRWQASS